MITEVTEKRVMYERDARLEYDGKWFLFDFGEFPLSEFKGYVVAYGDGTAQDRDALNKIVWDRYNGKALLAKGYKPEPNVDTIYGIYDS